jgi:alcohol dehydrogenase YqhD (iron-dependent ADH family)
MWRTATIPKHSRCSWSSKPIKDTNHHSALIALAIDHFEKHDGIQGQAQLARALYKQSLVFGVEQNEKRRKRSMKRAVDALTEYYEELGEDVKLQDPVTEQDFRRPLRFGYR